MFETTSVSYAVGFAGKTVTDARAAYEDMMCESAKAGACDSEGIHGLGQGTLLELGYGCAEVGEGDEGIVWVMEDGGVRRGDEVAEGDEVRALDRGRARGVYCLQDPGYKNVARGNLGGWPVLVRFTKFEGRGSGT